MFKSNERIERENKAAQEQELTKVKPVTRGEADTSNPVCNDYDKNKKRKLKRKLLFRKY